MIQQSMQRWLLQLRSLGDYSSVLMKKGPSQSQLQTLVTGYVQELGFQVPSESIIPQILKRINPVGETVFRDALLAGCQALIKLAQILQQAGQAQKWNLVHIVLTDGDDTGSEADVMTTTRMLYALGQLQNFKSIKTIVIGVGISPKTQYDINQVVAAGGQKAEYQGTSEAEISQIFERIARKIGLQKRYQLLEMDKRPESCSSTHQKHNSLFRLNIHNYAVMFNLSVSESMAGQKWRDVCQSVNGFVRLLEDNDLMGALVFNQQVKSLATISGDDELFKLPEQNFPRRVSLYSEISKRSGMEQAGEAKCCCQYM